MKPDLKNEFIVVLDACALIAFLNGEDGADVVTQVFLEISQVEIAAINVLEIAYDAVRRSGVASAAIRVMEIINALPVKIRWDLDPSLIAAAATFKTRFRISIADSVALAFAQQKQAPLVTCDHHEFDPIEAAGASRFVWIR